MNTKELHSLLCKELKSQYPDTASSIAWWIIAFLAKKTISQLLTQPEIDSNIVNQAVALAQEHIEHHKPLQYLFGSVPFLSLDIKVRPPILIPRPETEYWVSLLIEQLQQLKNQHITILDMCTGSGCIGLSIAKALPSAIVYGADISKEACDLARENAQYNRADNFHVIQTDLFSSLPKALKFDLIVSNPPYISKEEWLTLEPGVKDWEDPRALIADEGGVQLLRDIINESKQWLRSNSEMASLQIPQLVLEIGYNQGIQVQQICLDAGYTEVTIHKDLAGHDRFVTARDCS